MKLRVLLLSLLLLPLLAHADDAADLRAIGDAWDRAIYTRDIPKIIANLDDDFIQIDKHGTIHQRADFIRDITDPALKIDPYQVEDLQVRVFGNVALLIGKLTMSGSDGGEKWTSHFIYTDTYRKKNGRWRVVQIQITALP
ncbi:hypothetical protein BH10PSE17_BH10PSE17_04960 [soil metagenome]